MTRDAATPNDGRRRFTFPPSHRLGGRDAFRKVFDAGTRASRGPVTLYAAANGLAHPRLGLSVGRRVGKAVARNRLKRLLREAYRHVRHDLPAGYDYVVVSRPHAFWSADEYRRCLQDLAARAVAKQPRGPAKGESGSDR